MQTFLIIAAVIALILFILSRIPSPRTQKEEPEELRGLLTDETIEDFKVRMEKEYYLRIYGYIPDQFLSGKGEFGTTATNPIPTKSHPEARRYLDTLRTENDEPITYERTGSLMVDNIQKPVDIYEIYVNGRPVTQFFICPYHFQTSDKAPRGFKTDHFLY